MSVSLTNFMHSLAKFHVARAAARSPAVTIVYADTPRELFRLWAEEADANKDLYTVMRIYPGGGPLTKHPLPRYSFQWWTQGTNAGAVLERAQVIFETLLESDLQPLRMRTIPGYLDADDSADGTWTIVAVDPTQRPGSIGPDERGRNIASFNCDVGFFKAS